MSAGRAPASPAACGGTGLAPEQADPLERAVGQASAGVAVGAVEQQAGPQLGLGVGALVGQRGRVGRVGPARQHRPALDQDELAGDRHERS